MWRTVRYAAAQRQCATTLACRSSRVSLTTTTARSAASTTSAGAFTPRIAQSVDLRSSFLDYFAAHRHTLLPSSSLVPSASDDTLLFTNAGMVQLKDMLIGVEAPPAGSNGRLASAQKCLRAGGKHNDLENVGHTARHHTFFEMLGNFSIGNYFKEEAMVLAWNYLTKEIGLPPSLLRITVHTSDDESAMLWSKITGFSESADGTSGGGRILRLGDADNFWSMGDTPGTPCGPCSEIFFDQGAEVDGDRWLEIWNLVFMQYERGTKPGELIPLAKPCVDTGMGLERLAAILQHQPTNYDSDLLRPSIEAVRQLALERTKSPQTALPYAHGLDLSPHATAMKVIVDHVRSSAFLIAEGVVPSNIGRGYVLRRIIRRAVRYGTTIGLKEPFMSALLPPLLEKLGGVYPELVHRRETIESTLHLEEKNFFGRLEHGLRVLDDAFRKHPSPAFASPIVLPGDVAFRLYDSFGFPLDLTQVIARERGASVDIVRFEQLMKQQRELSKGTAFQTSSSSATSAVDSSSSSDTSIPKPNVAPPAELKRWQADGILNEFIGFDTLESRGPATIHAIMSTLEANSSLWITLDQTPFYANQGGQVGDIGIITLEDGTVLQVVDCIRPYDNCSVIRVHVPPMQRDAIHSLKVGTRIASAQVNAAHRTSVAIHHTATHLLHAALKQVLPTKATLPSTISAPSTDAPVTKKKSSPAAPVISAAAINQAGSLVAADRLRFDFNCPVPVTPAQILELEKWVNDAILAVDSSAVMSGASIQTAIMSKEEAMKMNATALFGEKYAAQVRVVSIPGYSVELCGGTHVRDLRLVYPFKILSEGGIASGIRRIEAVAGPAAFQLVDQSHALLKRVTAELKASKPDAILPTITKLQQRVRELEDEVSKTKMKAFLVAAANPANQTVLQTELRWSGITKPFAVKIHAIPDDLASTPGVLRDTCSALLASDPSSYHILLCSTTGAIAIGAGATQTLTDASLVTARQIWQRLERACARDQPKTKPRGGGTEKIVQGVLPIEYAQQPSTLTQRVVAALANAEN